MAASTAHLVAAGQPPEFEIFTDMAVSCGNKSYRCSSTALALESKVLCKMFQSTPRETWEKGVEATLADHLPSNVELMLALTHGGNDIDQMRASLKLGEIGEWGEIEDLLALVHKLNMPRLQQVSLVVFKTCCTAIFEKENVVLDTIHSN